MKAIREYLKTMFFMFFSVMILFVSGCGKKQADSVDFLSRVIDEIQREIPAGMSVKIEKVGFDWGESKQTDKVIYGSFTAVAIASEKMYERVPPNDLKLLGFDFITDDELGHLKSALAAKLDEINDSAMSLPQTSEQFIAVTNKINYARSLLDNFAKLRSYSYAKFGVEKGEEISVTGTINAIKLGAREWVPVEVVITGMELNGAELNGRRLFGESMKRDSVLIIEKNGTNAEVITIVAERQKTVEEVEEAVKEAEEAIKEAEAVEDALDAEIAKMVEILEREYKANKITMPSEVKKAAYKSNTLNLWYDESEIGELIQTNVNIARHKLFTALNNDSANAIHHYWIALLHYKTGVDSAYGYYDQNEARKEMNKAVELEPRYKDDPKIKETPCVECKGSGFVKCKTVDYVNTCPTCKDTSSKRYGCKTCGGKGTVPKHCSECGGKGTKECTKCDGTGKFFYEILGLK